MRELENELLAKKINDGRIFEPKIQDPLDDVIEILDKPEPEHKKTTFPYVEPIVQLPDEIEDTQKLIDGNFTDLQPKSTFELIRDIEKNDPVEENEKPASYCPLATLRISWALD